MLKFNHRVFLALVAGISLTSSLDIRANAGNGSNLDEARELCLNTASVKRGIRIAPACTLVIESRQLDAKQQARAHVRRGDVLQRRGKFYETQNDWSKAITIDPGNVPARLLLARSDLLANQYESALSHYRQVVRLAPENAEAHHGVGMALRRMGDFNQALDAFDKAIQIDPIFWKPHVEAAKVYEQLGDIEMALSSYAKAVVAYRSKRDGHFFIIWTHPKIQRAILLNMINQTRDAIVDLTSVIEQLGNNYNAYALRAEFYEAIGDYQRAAADHGSMIGFLAEPATGGHYFARARLHQKQGSFDAAIADMETAIRLGGVQSILKIQVLLKNSGFDDLEIDGKYTVDMRHALKRCMKSASCTKGLSSPI